MPSSKYYDEENVITSASKYHRPGCLCIQNIWKSNLRTYKSWKQPYEEGFVPCRVCNPYSPREKQEPPAGATEVVSLDTEISVVELGQLRRGLMALLDALEQDVDSYGRDRIPARIERLKSDGLIPYEIAAMMHVIVKMRNAAEYESKSLTPAESKAVRASWEAVAEWAQSVGCPPE